MIFIQAYKIWVVIYVFSHDVEMILPQSVSGICSESGLGKQGYGANVLDLGDIYCHDAESTFLSNSFLH